MADFGGVATRRPGWDQVPPQVRASIEAHLGAPVSKAATQAGGFSPALAARLRLSDGRRFFVKAIGPGREPGEAGLQESYRREARVTASLPATVSAPRLLGSWEVDGWVVLVLTDVEGSTPTLPWQSGQLEEVMDAMAHQTARLTPSPLQAPPAGFPGGRGHWSALAVDRRHLEALSGLDPWVLGHLGLLDQLESSVEGAFGGNTLTHADIRADNILLTERGVVFVDWAHACVGAAWLDLLFFLLSVALQGGPPPDELFWAHPTAAGADARDVANVLAGFAGFMVREATRPAPPGQPTFREFQLALGGEAIRWLPRVLNR